MYTIKTLNKISPTGLEVLDPGKYSISDDPASPDAIMVRSAVMHEYQWDSELKAIARAGAGTNNIPLDRCSEDGIVVFNSPGANAESVKELVLCGLFLSARDLVGGIQWVRGIAGEGDAVAKLVEKGKSKFAGPELMGKTLGVIGLGAIGAKVANAALSLGMKVYGCDPYLSVDAAWQLSSHVNHAENLETIYKNCDYISLHVPYMKETHEMICTETIAMMKDGVRIINMARAALVNDDDMLAALKSGKIAGYVTDFPNGKVAGAEKVIPIPHLGASTPESEDNCAVMAAQAVADYLENGNITNSVNMPAAYMERSGKARLCVIHQNVPAIISGILQVISDNGINVENMVNKSRGDYSYCLVDMNAPVNDDMIKQISGAKGIIRVRVIQ